MKRGKPLQSKTPMRKVSVKRKAHRASREGQDALAYMRDVKRLPCCICGAHGPSEAHHTINGRYSGRKTSDLNVIPLCAPCHRTGPNAIHNGSRSWMERNGPDYGYIDQTREAVKKLRDMS